MKMLFAEAASGYILILYSDPKECPSVFGTLALRVVFTCHMSCYPVPHHDQR